MDTEFAVDIACVDLGRVWGNDKPLRNLLNGQPLGDQCEDLKFTLVQRFDQFAIDLQSRQAALRKQPAYLVARGYSRSRFL